MMKTRVCVIGAGLSGLAVCKELREVGVEFRCYEMMPILGGVFGSHVWKGGCLTSSTVSTWYSDFPVEDRQRFMSWRELLDYFDRYVDHNGIRDAIELNSKIVRAEQTSEGWDVEIEHGNFSNGHPFHPPHLEVTPGRSRERFTHLIICSGLHQQPKLPDVPGLDGFSGQVLHSSEFRDAELHRDQNVVVVGAGESASDIAAQLAAVARECTISTRTGPGTLFPKWIQGNTPDIRDDRATYNLPRAFAPIIQRGHRRFYSKQTEQRELFEFAARSNWDNQRCSFNSPACKSFGIPEAVVHHHAKLAPAIASIERDKLRFVDGSETIAELIVFATGFRTAFPMLDPALADQLLGVDRLWKNAVSPELGDKLMVIGFARPHQINLITTAELQARMAAQVISGRKRLPERAQMQAEIATDRAFMQRHYGDRYRQNPALVDQLYFTDGLAEFIGCAVPWADVFRRDPELGIRLMYTAINGAHHRLAGPGANWELAARTIKATPIFNDKRNAVFRWSILTALGLAATLGSRVNPSLRPIRAQVRAQAQARVARPG
jgi:dimethylaniline monooxygenase (N-oxide forming)